MKQMNAILGTLLTLGLLASCGERINLEQVTRLHLSDYFVDETVKHLESKTVAKWATPSLRGTNKIVLTFDDGPGPYTAELLDILKTWNEENPDNTIAATFFVLGQNLRAYQDVALRALAEGHILASHDWDHTDNNLEIESTFKTGMTKTLQELDRLYRLSGKDFSHNYFRFPYGNYGKNSSYHHFDSMLALGNEIFGFNCLNYVFWDLDTSDWVQGISSEQVAQNLWAFLPVTPDKTFYDRQKVDGKWVLTSRTINKYEIGGGISLMHDVHLSSVKAIGLFLARVQAFNLAVEKSEDKIQFTSLTEVKEYSYPDDLNCILKPELQVE